MSSPKPARDIFIRIASFVSGLLIYLLVSRVILSHLDNGPLRIILSMTISIVVFVAIILTAMTIINHRKNKK